MNGRASGPPRKRNASGGTLANSQSRNNAPANSAIGRRPHQPASARAELQQLFTQPAQWVVAIKKATGVVVAFSTATCQSDAESTCARLRSFGLDASVKLIRSETVSPGTTLPGDGAP